MYLGEEITEISLELTGSPVTGEFPAQRPVPGALMFSFISAWINNWVNNRKAGNLGRRRGHYDVILTLGGYANEALSKEHVHWKLIVSIDEHIWTL